jgi:hypothetical protein
MGLVLVKEETLGWNWRTPSRYEKSVSVGSRKGRGGFGARQNRGGVVRDL